MNPSEAYSFSLLLLCIWREARGESLAAKLGVAFSIRNRTLRPSWWGHDWVSVILCSSQYSSFNANDPNATKFPTENDISYPDCQTAALAAFGPTQADPTGGATSYFDKSMDANPPFWAAKMTHTVDIDDLHFYK
jgi:N-acetylmuramoyl-L-alanine amidase